MCTYTVRDSSFGNLFTYAVGSQGFDNQWDNIFITMSIVAVGAIKFYLLFIVNTLHLFIFCYILFLF
jgi:hypothetical protein